MNRTEIIEGQPSWVYVATLEFLATTEARTKVVKSLSSNYVKAEVPWHWLDSQNPRKQPGELEFNIQRHSGTLSTVSVNHDLSRYYSYSLITVLFSFLIGILLMVIPFLGIIWLVVLLLVLFWEAVYVFPRRHIIVEDYFKHLYNSLSKKQLLTAELDRVKQDLILGRIDEKTYKERKATIEDSLV